MSMKNITPEVINTTKQIADLIDYLLSSHESLIRVSPLMYIDLEGVDLCRKGSLSILTLLIDMEYLGRRVCLIDVHTLGTQAFKTAGAEQKTLKDILQDEKIPKVFFDVRNDSDALFAHFGVALQGVEDVQLMESATRKNTASRTFVNSLATCIENALKFVDRTELASWKLSKEKGKQLFEAKHGGSDAVINQRPIPEDVISYCVGDVQYLPRLRKYFSKYRPFWWQDLVCEESKKRVAASQRSDYQPHGSHKVIAPWSKEQNIVLDNYFSLYDDWYDDDAGGPTNCRDIIFDSEYYYSD